jgi:hypothetical protein
LDRRVRWEDAARQPGGQGAREEEVLSGALAVPKLHRYTHICEAGILTSMPMPSWSLPVDCREAFPCAGVTDSARMDVSPWVFAVVGDSGAGGASLGAATEDVLLRRGMAVGVLMRQCKGAQRIEAVSPGRLADGWK